MRNSTVIREGTCSPRSIPDQPLPSILELGLSDGAAPAPLRYAHPAPVHVCVHVDNRTHEALGATSAPTCIKGLKLAYLTIPSTSSYPLFVCGVGRVCRGRQEAYLPARVLIRRQSDNPRPPPLTGCHVVQHRPGWVRQHACDTTARALHTCQALRGVLQRHAGLWLGLTGAVGLL